MVSFWIRPALVEGQLLRSFLGDLHLWMPAEATAAAGILVVPGHWEIRQAVVDPDVVRIGTVGKERPTLRLQRVSVL